MQHFLLWDFWMTEICAMFFVKMLLQTLLLLGKLCLSPMGCISLVVLSLLASDQTEVFGYVWGGICLTRYRRHLSPMIGALFVIKEEGDKGKEFLTAALLILQLMSTRDQVNCLLSEPFLSAGTGSRKAVLWRKGRKSHFFRLCQNSWRLDWKLLSALEAGVVPSCHCTARKFSCSRTALFLLSNPWDWPPQLPSGSTLCTPAWRYPTDVGWELCYLSAFCPFVACPCSCLSLQAGLFQAFVLCLQAQYSGTVKDSSLKT